jgi:hypothetical protein
MRPLETQCTQANICARQRTPEIHSTVERWRQEGISHEFRYNCNRTAVTPTVALQVLFRLLQQLSRLWSMLGSGEGGFE